MSNFFDITDGDIGFSISDTLGMSTDGDLFIRTSDTTAMDLSTGELHTISSWDDNDDN